MNNVEDIKETYFDSQREAMEEAARIRSTSQESDILVKVVKSPYGGYCLKMIPLDIAIDMAEHFPTFLCRQ